MDEPEKVWSPLMRCMEDFFRHEKSLSVMDRTNRRDVRIYRRCHFDGMASRIFVEDGWVEKRYRGTSESNRAELASHWRNEIHACERLGIDFSTPTYQTIRLRYQGESLNRENIPADWREQVHEIESKLAEKSVWDAEAKPKNICIRDGQLTFIDFGLVYFDSCPSV